MEEEMEELYVEGVATHGGPESCVVACEGGGEALTGGTCRPGYRATKCVFRGAHAVGMAEGNIGGGVIARRAAASDTDSPGSGWTASPPDGYPRPA